MQERHCLKTGNLCGTDTCVADKPCLCDECRAWILETFGKKLIENQEGLKPEYNEIVSKRFWDLF